MSLTDLRRTEAGAGHELSTRAFWARPASDRASTFEHLRTTAPVTFQPPPEFGNVPHQQGFWAVTRYDDVVAVSRQPEVFCSGQGVMLEDVPIEAQEMGSSFLVMDDPRHHRLRRIVSRAFTPRRIAELDEAIAAQAAVFVDAFVDAGGGDAVSGLSMHLPLWTISTMMGVPESLRPNLVAAVEQLVAAQDASQIPDGTDALTLQFESAITLASIATELATSRRASPGDDLISALVLSDADDGGLSDQTIASIFLLFAVAGNDTTRHSTTHGIRFLSEHPDQWADLRSDHGLLNSTVEEIVRCATPVIQFRRTATRPVELGGQAIQPGDRVVVFYESANRDEQAFEDPATFDIRRDSNHHVGFGGGGPHFCLGANLARTQLRATFRRLAERCTALATGEPVHLGSHFINGVRSLPTQIVRAN